MKRWLWLLFAISLFGRSIPEGYISPIPADILTKQKMRVHFGELQFDDGVPLPESQQKIADELAYMRLCEIYFNNHEAVWLELLNGELAKLGIVPNKTLALTASPITSKMLWPRLDPNSIYTVGVIDLKNAPLLLQLPKSFDSAFLVDHFGDTVATLQPGGSYLLYDKKENFLPYTQLIQTERGDKEVPTLQSQTYTNFLFIRMSRDANLSAFKSQLHIAPKDYTAQENDFVDISSSQSIVLLPKSARFFKLLDNIVQNDSIPAKKADELAFAGIDKNRAFQPDMHQRALLQDAARSAGIILQNTPSLRHLHLLGHDLNNTLSITLNTDDANNTLHGSNRYALHLPADIAAERWSVTLYDTQTGSMLQNPLQLRPYILSSNTDLLYNEDDSIDLYFTPQTTDDAMEINSIKTVAGKNFFAIVRFYDPTVSQHDISLQKLQNSSTKAEPDEDISVF